MWMYFAKLHPVVIAVYLIGMFGITMCSMNPYIVGGSLFVSFFLSCLAEKAFLGKRLLGMAVPILFFAVGILPLFSHNGVTPLFYINDMPVTLETICYGVVMSGLLVAIGQWFQIWNVWIDSERFLYLFGRISPTLALLVSMVLRFIPMMLRRFRHIQDIQKGMGYTSEDMTIADRCRLFGKELSILVSWSLEHSMDTSMSMEGRGYGTCKRTSFHRFYWKIEDVVMLIVEIVLFLIVIGAFLQGKYKTYYFPVMLLKPILEEDIIGVIGLIGLSLLPLLLQGKEILCHK